MGKVVLTTGVFDCGMHIGHFMLLWKCYELAGPDGEVIVGVNTEASARSYKRTPVFSESFRHACVENVPFVKSVHSIDKESDIIDLIKNRRVDYYVKGSEWSEKKVTGSELCTIVLVPPVEIYNSGKVSTTQIINRIKSYEHN